MTRKSAVLLIAGALAVVAATATGAGTAATGGVSPGTAKSCTNGVPDRINGRTVCVHVGGTCLAAHNARYRARGFACVNGRLRRVAKPGISIGDASVAEGNSGTTILSAPVTLSAASGSAVTVGYATADGTASAGSDYTAASGTLVFRAGETQKTIAISVQGDTAIEGDETFTVTLSNPVNGKLARASATATITNDDTAAAITPGSYQGLAGNGSFVFFTVTPDRTITALRFNDLSERCDPPATLPGGSDFGTNIFPVDSAGRFHAAGSWSGSETHGDVEYTSWSADVLGVFASPTSVSGTITEKYGLNYRGTHYTCSSGQVTWSARRQG